MELDRTLATRSPQRAWTASVTHPFHYLGRWSSGPAGDQQRQGHRVHGDTLFERAIEPAPTAGGGDRDLLRSIVDKLLVLDDSTVVLPGRNNSTTIGPKRRFNPFLEGLSR